MAQDPVEENLEEEVLEEQDQQQEEGEQPFLYSLTGQAPWWVVSVLLHVLVISLAALMTMSMKMPAADDATVMVTELAARPEVQVEPEKPKADARKVLESDHDTPPTDPTSQEASDIVVPPDILAKAELGDHFETINPDRPDTHSAFGNPDAHMFHSVTGNDEPPGGGGMGGASLDDVIGVGGAASPGTGGGWGGGHGTGTGVDTGSGHGSFGSRNGGGRRLMVKRHGGSRKTENAVDAALRWLATHQEPDGHWDSVKYGGKKFDTAMTGLALLAFLGAGHTEKVGTYKTNVQKAVAWLKSKQAANGQIADTTDVAHCGGYGYVTSIASLAMAEAAGMANIKDTRDAAQKAIDCCTNVYQMGDGSDKGGWRYVPKGGADISVSGWFIMALKSAKVAGVHVDPAAFEGAIKTLDKLEGKNVAQGSYGPASVYHYVESEQGAGSNGRRCAIGNLARQFLGWKKEDLQSSVEYFMTKYGTPDWGANGEKVDLYYWYYGTLCVFQQGGDLWKKWNENMKKALCDNQSKNGDDTGSWDPKGDFSDVWGRVGQTAICCLCLEVYYRYQQLQPGS